MHSQGLGQAINFEKGWGTGAIGEDHASLLTSIVFHIDLIYSYMASNSRCIELLLTGLERVL